MEKILVILMLGAGFVTVASATEPLDCTTNPTNQCCDDSLNLGIAINITPGNRVTTLDGHLLEWIDSSSLVNDGVPLGTWCEDNGVYTDTNPATHVVVTWLPGDWVHSIRTTSASDPLDCTNNTTNQCCVDVHSIENEINQSPPNYSITTTDNYELLSVSQVLFNNDGTDVDNTCVDYAVYKQDGQRTVAVFQWAPGRWVSTIKFDGPDLSAK